MILLPIALSVLAPSQAVPNLDREVRVIKFLHNRAPTVAGGRQFHISDSYNHVLLQFRSELTKAKGWTLETYPARYQGSVQSRTAFFLKGRVEIRVQDITRLDFGRKGAIITFKLNAP